ncbi:MAG: siphovirus Gp157 family protein [Chitinophagaceae bacterium]|nr:siphovirus Gp157 family protein [Chitinophagaceae bacterium]
MSEIENALDTLESELMSAEKNLKSAQAYLQKITQEREEQETFVIDFMKANEVEELCGSKFLFRLVNNPPSVSVIDEKLISDDYKTIVQTTKIDKKRISEDLKLGVAVNGCELVQGKRLKIEAMK